MFAYCGNNPINADDHNGNYPNTRVELGHGWYAQVHTKEIRGEVKRHIHVYNEQKGLKYAQREDGGPHDEGGSKKGSLPKKVQKALLKK